MEENWQGGGIRPPSGLIRVKKTENTYEFLVFQWAPINGRANKSEIIEEAFSIMQKLYHSQPTKSTILGLGYFPNDLDCGEGLGLNRHNESFMFFNGLWIPM